MSESSQPGMSLSTLLEGYVVPEHKSMIDDACVDVSGVCLDSRLISAGDVYLAMSGASTHGMLFIDAALNSGACAVVVDSAGMRDYVDAIQRIRDAGKLVVRVAQLKRNCGAIAARFYQHPSQQLAVVAVTGTDGKTSVCRFVADALNGSGQSCGYIGTLGWGLSELAETELTTPDAVTLQRMMAGLRDKGASVVALEASSHALSEGRLDAINIDVAVLTNFGRDHLDYHQSIRAYKEAKASLFSWPELTHVVLNGNDELGRELFSARSQLGSCSRVLFYAGGLPENALNELSHSSKMPADICVRAEEVDLHNDGIRFSLIDNGERFEQQSALLGSFNVENLLACHSVLRALGHAANDASMALNHVRSVPGRIEKFSALNKPTAIVDFAHTPQALAAVIAAVRRHCDGELWVVFGCGGDRDPGKRALMGAAAERADHVVVTDDNPRTEKSDVILEQIVAGMSKPELAVVIADRSLAINHALSSAAANDLVLIAGKGHEDYQVIGTQKRDYSDRDTVRQFMQEAI